jgi:hypothetical protein
MLPWSDCFNGNGFASGKLLWRLEKLLISDGAASSSGDVVIASVVSKEEDMRCFFLMCLSYLFSSV